MWWGVRKAVGSLVALRKESVDRNLCLRLMFWPFRPSLSARRAWIEITGGSKATDSSIVALRKESVDRNIRALGRGLYLISRSPQGERG